MLVTCVADRSFPFVAHSRVDMRRADSREDRSSFVCYVMSADVERDGCFCFFSQYNGAKRKY